MGDVRVDQVSYFVPSRQPVSLNGPALSASYGARRLRRISRGQSEQVTKSVSVGKAMAFGVRRR